MTEQTPEPETGARPTADQPPSTPGWVKAFVIVLIVLALLAAVAFATGLGGEHGPGRHLPSGNGGHLMTSSLIEVRTLYNLASSRPGG